MKPLAILIALVLVAPAKAQQHGNTPEARNGKPAPAGKCYDCFGKLRDEGGIPDVCCRGDKRNRGYFEIVVPADQPQESLEQEIARLRKENRELLALANESVAVAKEASHQTQRLMSVLSRLLLDTKTPMSPKHRRIIEEAAKVDPYEKYPPKSRSPLAPIRAPEKKQ